MQHIGVGSTYRVCQHLVSHIAAVDEEILGIGTRAAHGRGASPAMHANRAGILFDFPSCGRELVGHQAQGALAWRLRRQREHRAALMRNGERYRRMRGSRTLDLRQAVRQLGGLATQKFAAGWCLVKQIGDFDARAD